jgi:hypothetical protein
LKPKFDAAHRFADKDAANATRKPSTLKEITLALADAEAKIKTLETAVRSRGDSLFDIVNTPPAQIARIIVEEAVWVGKFTKAQQIKAALEKEIAAKKKIGGEAQAG